jgi:hypothetical protein
MNNGNLLTLIIEIMYTLAKNEYIRAFVNSNLRYDRRDHKEKRVFKYEYGNIN